MLVLTRKLQQQIKIGDDIIVTVLKVKGNTVRIGIDAPRDVRIVRAELPIGELEVELADENTAADAIAEEVTLAAETRGPILAQAQRESHVRPEFSAGQAGLKAHVARSRSAGRFSSPSVKLATASLAK